MSIVLQSSGGGSVTIQEPATASNLTATLPAATGTVMVSGNMPAFSAYQSTNQSVTSGVYTKVACNTEEFDTNSNYDTTNYRFIPQVAGYYQVTGNIYFNSASGNSLVVVAIYKNGSVAKYGSFTYPASAPAATFANATAIIYCNGTTDYLELYGYLLATTSPSFVAGSTSTYFQACLVRTS